MDILRIATAGSVDDGKSTLIGRLLYETNSVTQDKLDAIVQAGKRRGLAYVDLSLLTDGLVAEREQGITIDVAHIYFGTPKRKFIVADTPGHVEYTRNMITGACTAHVAIVLVDVRKGLVEQTYRHYYITQLLRIPHVVVCVNKMDLVDYSEAAFVHVRDAFLQLTASASFAEQQVRFVPLASLYGDNIASPSAAMPWYSGPHLLEFLEQVEYRSLETALPARFPVQQVIRPKTAQYHDFRGLAGRVASGTLHKGQRVLALPAQQQSVITAVYADAQELDSATAGSSVVITLADAIDMSRGGMLVPLADAPDAVKELTADVCWLDEQPLQAGRTYLLQHGINRVKAKVAAVHHRMNVATYTADASVDVLHLNEIGRITVKLAQPVFADRYAANKHNGAFILIDEQSHTTAGVGVVA